jgi:hypothetical protein
MSEVLIAFGGVAFGFLLGEGRRLLVSRRENMARLRSLRAEIVQCQHLIELFMVGGVMAPLYRLPSWAASNAFPRLIGDGVLQAQASETLLRYLSTIEEINRGLERAGDAHASRDEARLQDEYGRLQHKLEQLRQRGALSGLITTEQALAALDAEISRRQTRAMSRLGAPFCRLMCKSRN